MIPNRTGAEVNDPRPVNLKTFAVFGEICLATGTVVHEVPTSPTLGSGAGAPTHTRPDGSVFLRTDGAAGSTTYAMISGVWTPVDSGGTAETAKALDDLLGHTLTAEDGELNTGARHDQNTDQYLDEGGLNQSTAADVKDAVDKVHVQGTDQYLDEGGGNQSTAADVADAVSKKHDRSHDLDSSSDHTIGSGAEGQVIGVSAGALGWVTPGGSAGFVEEEFPVAKDWQADGPGVAGLWTGSGDLTDFDVLTFSGNALNFSLANSSGVTKTATFILDLSAYRDLHYMDAFVFGLRQNLTTLGNTASIQEVLEHTSGQEQDGIFLVGTAGNPSLYVFHRFNNNLATGGSSAVTQPTNASRMFFSRVGYGDGSNGTFYNEASGYRMASSSNASYPHIQDGTLQLRLALTVPDGVTLTGLISDIWVGPLYLL